MDNIISDRIKINPKSIIYINNLNEEIVNLAILNGYMPSKEDFFINPFLKDYKVLVDKLFENDSSALVFYSKKDLTKDIIFSAFNRGYIPTKEDLEKYPELSHNNFFMQEAILINPSLIVYLKEDCSLPIESIKNALSKYKITEQDLLEHKALRDNLTIISLLPEFRLYYSFLGDNIKMFEITNALENNLEVTKLPFLNPKFGGKCELDKLNELISYLKMDIKSNSIEYQKKYYLILDRIIDGILNIRYLNSKKALEYPDIVSLNNKVIETFKMIIYSKDYSYIDYLTKNLAEFTYNVISKEEITIELYKYYELFIKNGKLDIDDTKDFYNKILNTNRSMFMRKEKNDILNNIVFKIHLSKRKILSLNNGKKIEKVGKLIKDNNFESLGISKKEFDEIVNNTKSSILNNKDIKKLGITIDILALDKLINLFLYFGEADKNMIKTLLNIDNTEVINYIYNKIVKIKYLISQNVKIEEYSELDFISENNMPKLDYSNYLILDKSKYLYNMANIILSLDNELLNKILENKDLLKDLVFLIPLLNLLDEFDINTFINIMCYYERIDYKLHRTSNYEDTIDIKELLLKRIDDLITLGNAYASVDDITLAALGNNVVNSIGDENSNKYLEFYLNMLNRKSCNIPNIFLTNDNNYRIKYEDEIFFEGLYPYYFESGFYSDPDRLTIGKKPYRSSCIDLLNTAGVKTYNTALLNNNGNVILVKDKNKKMMSRIFVFRKGNTINMISSMIEAYPLKLYQDIADQIMQHAINSGDNIDYIFVNYKSVYTANNNFIKVKDSRLKDNFPHPDFVDTAILLTSKNMMKGILDSELNLDFDCEPKGIYYKDRKPINYSPSEEELTRIKALNIYMEQDSVKKEYMKRKFEPVYLKEYNMAIAGEDWYILVRYDNTLEEVILPSTDPRTYEEVFYIKNALLNNQSKGLM